MVCLSIWRSSVGQTMADRGSCQIGCNSHCPFVGLIVNGLRKTWSAALIQQLISAINITWWVWFASYALFVIGTKNNLPRIGTRGRTIYIYIYRERLHGIPYMYSLSGSMKRSYSEKCFDFLDRKKNWLV